MSEVEVVDDVTFVGGVAAEQNTDGESSLADGERAAAIAAVKEALKTEGEQAAKDAKAALEKDPLVPKKPKSAPKEGSPERGEDGKFLPKTDPTAAAPDKPVAADDDDAETLKRTLRERKQVAAIKAQQAQEYQRQTQQLQQFQAQLQAQARQIEQEKARLARLRSDPAQAIRDNGWDPESFILDVAQEGTPEGQERRRQRAMEAKLKEFDDWKASLAKQAEEQEQASKRQQATQYRQQVEDEYLKIAMDEERHPFVASLYKDNETGLIALGDDIAEKYRRLTGKEASFSDIAEYLEERTALWYKSRVGNQNPTASQQVAAPVTQGRPTQGSATGRTLSPNGSSERRTLGMNLKDLDGDERREAAMEAVKHALNASGERQ